MRITPIPSEPIRTPSTTGLNALGREEVIRLGLEWRHPPDGGRIPAEYDNLKGANNLLQ